MENYFSIRIQIVSIIVSLVFLLYVSRLIIKGKLREEYAIFWVLGTIILIVFSFWRHGLDVMAKLVGVYMPPNLIFMGAIFAILVYLLHLSTVVSKLYDQNKSLAQKIALLQNKMDGEQKEVQKEETEKE
ncbi:MAG: DUF2304 domain-containing protein [Saprospiraceae bacterium]|nr:DUF2304 domain-containing protein [Saprospiraceae bacterium]